MIQVNQTYFSKLNSRIQVIHIIKSNKGKQSLYDAQFDSAN